MYHHNDTTHFRVFAESLERLVEQYGGIEEITLVERQKAQLERLVELEKEFRETLVKHPWGPGVYRAFLYKILRDERNILAARPYFRERQDVFTNRIAKALKRENEKTLYKFHFNYRFVQFVVNQRKWPKTGKIVKLAQAISDQRLEIVEMNLPLAISRARIFWSRTPKSHLTYMDLIQIATEGLMSAVDKFCLPYSRVFRSVAIGRMVGNLIEGYSDTLVHFYPQDKRKIYRANKLMHKYGDLDNVDFEGLAQEINDKFQDGHTTNGSEVHGLLSAASCVSADSAHEVEQDGHGNLLEYYAADEANRPDNIVESTNLKEVLVRAYSRLTIMERKLLVMKGIKLS